MVPRRTARRRTRVARSCIAAVVIVAEALSPRPARADEFWKTAKDYSATLAATAEAAAVAGVAAAKVALDSTKRDLDAAKALVDSAKTLAASAAASEILAACQAELAATTLAYATAQKVAIAAAAVAAGIAAGTIIGEAADWLISRCWDPTCPIRSIDPRFVPLTDADIDVIIQGLLAELHLTVLAASRADFELADEAVPGSGSAAWKFLHTGILTAVTAIQGAASSSAGLCPDVLAAARVLQSALSQYSCSITNFSGFVAAMQIYGDDPRPALDRAKRQILELRTFLAANPEQFTNRVQLRAIIGETLRALRAARATIDELTGPDGKARTLDGADGFFPALTLDGFLRFLEDCATRGVACLPPGEARTADGLFSIVGAKFAHQHSVGPEIAAYLAIGDSGQESELFRGGALHLSEVLQTAVPHHWQVIDLTSSPLVQACGAGW